MINHPYGQTDPFEAPDLADEVLNEYLDIAEVLNIETCLIYGSCLGFTRDGGYIKGDWDIDVVIIGERIDGLTTELLKNGFDFKLKGEENSHFLKRNIFLDIFYDYLLPQKEFLKSFDMVEYRGQMYSVPHPVEEYLVSTYGDWKTRKPKEVWAEEKAEKRREAKRKADE